MKVVLHTCLFLVFWCCLGVHCQLSCNKCTGSTSGRGSCGSQEKCAVEQTRCLAIRWGANNQHGKTSNTYDTRCATADECSQSGRQQLCSDNHCEVKCCESSQCDPFTPSKIRIIHADARSFRCFECSRESLGSCESTEQTCDDDQDACISFMMEGGNHNKVYTKRCARKNECTDSELNRLCALEKNQSNRKECRASCCFDELCNHGSLTTTSLLVITIAALSWLLLFF